MLSACNIIHNMADDADKHLRCLASAQAQEQLSRVGLAFTAMDQNLCAAIRFKQQQPQAPLIVGLLGGASSGKSTLFNTLIQRPASAISALAHETVGPVVGLHEMQLERIKQWVDDNLLLGDFEAKVHANSQPTAGSLNCVTLVAHPCGKLKDSVLIDTPDVTSKMSQDEGALTARMRPWFDALVIVLDEERWFDALIFKQHTQLAAQLAQPFLILFNCTSECQADDVDVQVLEQHAHEQHADAYCSSPYQPGVGQRMLADETRNRIMEWVSRQRHCTRLDTLQQFLSRRCDALIQENFRRSAQFTELCRGVDERLTGFTDETHLTLDLLTPDERELLGIGRRFLPFYDLIRQVQRRLTGWSRFGKGAGGVAFEKDVDTLAEVLRRNMQQRFQRATDGIDEFVLTHPYHRDGQRAYVSHWEIPSIDEHAWARQIRSHIDTWKQEAATRSRRGDVLAMLFGAPLLVADLLLLGGAGLTLGWTAASLAGFVSGKGVYAVAGKSKAFEAYRNTVSAYQSLLSEALSEQWADNLELLPRRHLKMSDPTARALMYFSTHASEASRA